MMRTLVFMGIGHVGALTALHSRAICSPSAQPVLFYWVNVPPHFERVANDNWEVES